MEVTQLGLHSVAPVGTAREKLLFQLVVRVYLVGVPHLSAHLWTLLTATTGGELRLGITRSISGLS